MAQMTVLNGARRHRDWSDEKPLEILCKAVGHLEKLVAPDGLK